MENHEDNKVRNELSRVPSPSSVSSVHSVRPLEWDSGADIGYRCKVSSNLSTVERMALVRGTVNLFETCQPVNIIEKFNAPLAHSSPFVAIANVYGRESSNFDKNEPIQRLVDYSFHDEDVSFSSKPVGSNCKSLDDLRRSIRQADCPLSHRSRSTNNIPATRKSSNHLSASSLATIKSSRRYSNKAVQVSETSLRITSSSKSCPTSSGIEPLTTSSNNPTYTIEGSKYQSKNTSDESYNGCPSSSRSTNRSQSNANSSDGGSFEYVPGSIYDVRDSGRKSSLNSDSDLNTLCSEVVDGVELITRYVNDLRVSNKSKVIRKIVQSLTNNLSSGLPERNGTVSQNNFDLFDNSSRELENQTKRTSINSRNTNNISSRSALSSDQTTSGDIPVTRNSISDSVSIRGVSQTASDFSAEDRPNPRLKFRNGSGSSTSTGPLKEFLVKERENQLLWIKSGIDHLNNLKRLYEQQKILKKNLNSLKKNHSMDVTSTRENSQKQSSKSQLRKQQSGTSMKNQYQKRDANNLVSVESSLRSSIEIRKTSSTMSDQSALHSNKTIRSKECYNRYKPKCKYYDRWSNNSENKENLSQNRLQSQIIEPRPKFKPAVSYFVLFDKKPSFVAGQNYSVKEEIIRQCVRGEYLRRNTSKKKSVSKTSTKSIFTLQDYLLQNKPEYVNKAECRRQCLGEIAKLRQLRDKSRTELISSLQNEPDKVQCSVPPPLSVIRIFDDKSMKQQTARKYQQLPEVQNKKSELKRQESYRRNQIMAKIFTKKLQKKVLRGQVNLSNSVNLISV